jgi:hypothetical protein
MIGEIRDDSKLTTAEIMNPATPRSQYQNRPSNMTTQVAEHPLDLEANGDTEMRRDAAAAGTVVDAPLRTADRMQESRDMQETEDSQRTRDINATQNLQGTQNIEGTQNVQGTRDIMPDQKLQSDRPGQLFPDNELNQFRARWDKAQILFVDEPRAAVEQADSLVATVVTRIAEQFAAERADLEHQWDRGDNVSTEDLRQALRRYRGFFDRLLAF